MSARRSSVFFLIAAVVVVCVTSGITIEGKEVKEIYDFGNRCEKNSDCNSGICGSSCSARDESPFATTSCICPCNAEDRDGPCCCGCVSSASPTQAVACPAGDSQNEKGEPAYRALPAGEVRYFYARLTEAGALEGEAVEWGDAKLVGDAHQVKYDGSLYPGGKQFGELCEKNSDCALGICGFGCECDSALEKACSCNAPSHFPVQVCAGCNRGKHDTGKKIGACPKGVGIEQLGRTQVWQPSPTSAKVSPAYCTIVELAVRGDPKWSKAISQYPEACRRGDNAKVAELFNGTDYQSKEQVEKLYSSLLSLLCSWNPPPGTGGAVNGTKVNQCKKL